MSYSRWSNSRWYTFHSVGPEGQKETKDNAIFEICGANRFTAKELRDDLQGCIDKAKQKDIEQCGEDSATIEEIEELKEYIDYFLQDIDSMYE